MREKNLFSLSVPEGNRQVEYGWIRLTANRYKNFSEISDEALRFAVLKSGLELKNADRQRLVDAYNHMDLWPDVLSVLTGLKSENIKTGILSNMTQSMLDKNISQNGLEDYLHPVLSTDSVRSYKPSIQSYQLGRIR